jgi:hypothetical protein
MKSDNLLRHLMVPFGIAVLIYVVFYTWIEHRRTRKGPWEVTFTNSVSGAATLVINQPALAVTNLQITFPGETARTNASLSFSRPQEVPWDLPYGKCVFMDTTFLPGTITIDLFGHEIELIPRVLTIDHQEMPWVSDKTILVAETNAVAPSQPKGGTTNR